MTDTPKNLTLEEVAEILLKKDTRTIQSYIDKGFLKAITLDGVVSITATELAEKLGVTDFNEKFIDEFEARVIVNVTTPLTLKYCQERVIPFFTLKHTNNKGDRILFKRSLIEDWKSKQFFSIDADVNYIEHLARVNTLQIWNQNFRIIASMLNLPERQENCIDMYLNGSTLEHISERTNLSRDRVRQLLARVVRQIGHFSGRLSSVQEAIKNSSFRDDILLPWDIVSKFDALQKNYQKLKESNEKILAATATLPENIRAVFLESITEETQTIAGLKKNPILKKHLSDFDFSVRLYTCLRAAGVNTVEELTQHTWEEILKFKNFGKKSLNELEDFIREHELVMGMPIEK